MTIARHTFALTLAAALASATLAACHQDAPADTAPLAVTQPPPVRDAPLGEDARRIAADVNVLADDRMEGRQTGSRGFDLAADHVAAQFRAIGLQPAGDDGTYFQAVPLLRATRVAEGAALVVKRNGRQIALRFGDQFLPGLDYDAAEHAIEAPAVFVGQGVHAPELGHDDFAGLDLRGRIAVVFAGAPARFDHPQRALHSAQREKLRAIAARGAIGVVFVNTPQDEAGAPWARAADNWQRPGMRLRGADGKALQEVPGLRATATASAAAADLIFADGPRPAAALFAAAQDGTLKGFALPGTLALAGRTRIEPLTSRNVVARLPGGDAALAGEHLAYTAHLDHVGIGAPVKNDHGVEDRIYNGALDNALGVAILLETARILHAAPSAPKRSLLFAALTGEEQGLLGAEWLVAHPPAAATALVANLNIDMPVLLAPSKDIVAIGAAHSSLQAVVEAAAGEVPVALSPDPFPEDVAFVRSDQYAFVRAGIPAVYLAGGVESADGVRDPRLALRKFMLEHYHQPSDEPSLPIAYGDAARLARLNARIGQRVADAAQRPAWKAGDLFGTRFAPVSAPAAGRRTP